MRSSFASSSCSFVASLLISSCRWSLSRRLWLSVVSRVSSSSASRDWPLLNSFLMVYFCCKSLR